ncbi:MAG TPA: FAD-dependent oxidoreductase [Allosphingosinicella sp.]|nr:FAD-dependent oxidoreductase [Allosphingosinicella sp.]
MSRSYDVAIVGAGMAGASLAAEIAGAASVLILEAEARPGFHATGRSAAFWSETYGGPLIQPLTSASRPALTPFLSPRGAIHVADAAGREALAALSDEFAGAEVALERLDRGALEARLPGLRPGWDEGLYEPSCADIDVAGLHAFYLAKARRAGAVLATGARVARIERAGSGWLIDGNREARILVNAAGAWADEVAALAGEAPIGIAPHRRTIAQLRVDPPVPYDLPLVVDAAGRFYFKPEAGGRLWLSPHDETPSAACDCAPEEIDVAIAIDRLERVVDWRIERVEHKWAGLRSFAPDRLPVYGYSGSGRGFFWCAGQGGFGIQTAPAAAALAAGLLLGRPPGAIDPTPYLAARFEN